jgi:hypothetical protein
MNDGELFDETVAQLAALVRVIDGLSEDLWDVPSLCARWRIREETAYITVGEGHSVDTHFRVRS